MKTLLPILAALFLLSVTVSGDALDEDYGYVDVRPGAHMFWVAYHTELPGEWTDYPLILWLQGGPGASGVGYGNFWELGPYDIEGNLRPGRWTQKANLMFVDNPVGTGYSYVDDLDLLCVNNAEIAADLVTFLTSVFTDYPDMQVMPFFIYAESYGGKMTADFAIALDAAIKAGNITSNFQGIAMGDSWISPMDSVNTWGSFLYSMGFVNSAGQESIDNSAANTQDAVDNENWGLATTLWSVTEAVVITNTEGVDFYNVLVEDSSVYDFFSEQLHKEKYSYMDPSIFALYSRHVMYTTRETRDDLYDYMNGDQADAWGIPDTVTWGGQSGDVFNYLSEDFMKPVTASVEYLLTSTNIHVAVYTGDLDLICDTPGTYLWISNLEYPTKPDYETTTREALNVAVYPNNAAYVQRFERFSVFTILRSGHMVPIDAPEMCLNMIDMITAYGAEASRAKVGSEEQKNKVNKVHSKMEQVKKAHVDEHAKKAHVDEQAKKTHVDEQAKKEQDEDRSKELKEAVKKIQEKKEHAKAAKVNIKEQLKQAGAALETSIETPNEKKEDVKEKIVQVKVAPADTGKVEEKTIEKEIVKEKKEKENSASKENKKQAEVQKIHLKSPEADQKVEKGKSEEVKNKLKAAEKVLNKQKEVKEDKNSEKTA